MIDGKRSAEPVSQSLTNSQDHNDKTLVDLFFQLWKGKFIIILGIVLMVVIAFIYQHNVKRTWTSSVVISTPSQADLAIYESVSSDLDHKPGDVVSGGELQRVIFATFKDYLSIAQIPAGSVFESKPTSTGQLELTLKADSSQEAHSQLIEIISNANNNAVAYYINDLKAKIEAAKSRLHTVINAQEVSLDYRHQLRLNALESAEKTAISAGIKTNQLTIVNNLQDQFLYLLGSDNLKAMIEENNRKISGYDEKLYTSKLSLSVLNNLDIKSEDMKSYFYVKEPSQPVKSDSNRMLLHLFLAILVGGFLGCLIVVMKDLVKDSIKRKFNS